MFFLQNLPCQACCCATLSPIRARNPQKPSTEGKMEYTERTENTMVNLLVMGATVARWIRGRSELRAEDFREKSSKVGLRHKVSEKSAETEKASENSLFKKERKFKSATWRSQYSSFKISRAQRAAARRYRPLEPVTTKNHQQKGKWRIRNAARTPW